MPADKEKSHLLFPNEFATGPLTDKEISSLIQGGLLIVKNFESTSLEASSYDVRVGMKGIIGGDGTVREISENQLLEIHPGQYAGVISLEKFNLPKTIFARIGSKRALSYEGLILLTGNIIDPGYQGHLLFGIYNASQKKAVLYLKKKICNVVFEKLSQEPLKQVIPDPFLLNGNFPESFIEKMVNSEALAWMQISERVKEIEMLKKDLSEIRNQYNDVLTPIRELTNDVQTVNNSIEKLKTQTESLGKDVDDIKQMVLTNNNQINQLTTSLQVLTSEVGNVKSNIRDIDQGTKETTGKLSDLRADFGRQKLIATIFWGILLVLFGAILAYILPKIFG